MLSFVSHRHNFLCSYLKHLINRSIDLSKSITLNLNILKVSWNVILINTVIFLPTKYFLYQRLFILINSQVFSMSSSSFSVLFTSIITKNEQKHFSRLFYQGLIWTNHLISYLRHKVHWLFLIMYLQYIIIMQLQYRQLQYHIWFSFWAIMKWIECSFDMLSC